MIYYNSRYLSTQLDINLAKWKRWVREFLPPDPLGGQQSGYARQFNLKEAFRVHLGGILVSVLRFSIAETRIILRELDAPLKELGVYSLYPKKRTPLNQDKWLQIYPMEGNRGFFYKMDGPDQLTPYPDGHYGHLLNLSKIYHRFLKAVAN